MVLNTIKQTNKPIQIHVCIFYFVYFLIKYFKFAVVTTTATDNGDDGIDYVTTDLDSTTTSSNHFQFMSFPEITQTSTTLPEITQASTTFPEIKQTGTTLLDITQASTTFPELSPTGTILSEIIQASTTSQETTQTSTTLPEITQTSTTSPETTQTMTCPCPCSNNILDTDDKIRQRLLELKTTLRVDKGKLSSSIRKLNSAVDNRYSVQCIGFGGLAILIIVPTFIVMLDIITVVKEIKLRIESRKTRDRV